MQVLCLDSFFRLLDLHKLTRACIFLEARMNKQRSDLPASNSVENLQSFTSARVAVADEIGSFLKARLSIILIGERPGLSAADSLSVYITYHPAPGTTDESRNCVSNIRPEGLPFSAAAEKIAYLVNKALKRQISGVILKDESDLMLGE